jgi:hypothetical protein
MVHEATMERAANPEDVDGDRGFGKAADVREGGLALVRSFNANRDNPRRWHSALDYPSPIAYETREQSLA